MFPLNRRCFYSVSFLTEPQHSVRLHSCHKCLMAVERPSAVHNIIYSPHYSFIAFFLIVKFVKQNVHELTFILCLFVHV